MKTNKKQQIAQRRLLDKKLLKWMTLRGDMRPPTGWIKAVRGALGLNIRQVSVRLGVDHSSILRLEERETQGKVTIELLEKVAEAMECKLIYAIVPKDSYKSLEDVVDDQARQAAQEILMRVEHSMRLEQQGDGDLNAEIEELALDLKNRMDSKIWDVHAATKKRRDKA